MIKGRLVMLRLLSCDNNELEYFCRASCDSLCMENTSDKWLKIRKSKIKNDIIQDFNDPDSTNYIFCILLNKVRVGILYILADIEKRTAEIQVLIGDEKYRSIGLGFDALFTATRFAHEELNLHSVTFKIASHNESMLKGFRVSQAAYRKLSNNGTKGVSIDDSLYRPDIISRKSFVNNGKVGDFYCYTFILDDKQFPFDDFLKLSSGKFNNYKNREGKLCIR